MFIDQQICPWEPCPLDAMPPPGPPIVYGPPIDCCPPLIYQQTSAWVQCTHSPWEPCPFEAMLLPGPPIAYGSSPGSFTASGPPPDLLLGPPIAYNPPPGPLLAPPIAYPWDSCPPPGAWTSYPSGPWGLCSPQMTVMTNPQPDLYPPRKVSLLYRSLQGGEKNKAFPPILTHIFPALVRLQHWAVEVSQYIKTSSPC